MIVVYHIALPENAVASPRKKSKTETLVPRRQLRSEDVNVAVQLLMEKMSPCPSGFDSLVAQDGLSASFCLVPGALFEASKKLDIDPASFSESDIAAARAAPRIIRLQVDGMELTAFGEVVWTRPASSSAARSKKVLVVGAGGIGCELLKVATLNGFRDITVVDLDTIDATNLNRQFLFRKEDVGQPKAVTARKAMLALFDSTTVEGAPTIAALHANIKDPIFSVDYFKQFSIVMNGLDNTSARKHVNRLCMQADVPLIESGTMGYNGQVQPICRSVFECYDCQPKSSEQKTFAVCTIHAHPSTMVHCTHYAKEFYGRLFGDATGADEMAFVETIPTASLATAGGAMALFKLIFEEKIDQLVGMRQQWLQQPPRSLRAADIFSASVAYEKVEQHIVLPLETLASVFVSTVTRCAQRPRVPFRKDDVLSTVLVAVVANLRATCFHIANQSISDVVTIAGSIVPAIATTNAIIAASVVAQAEALLDRKEDASFVYVRKAPQVRRRMTSSGLVRDKLILHSNSPPRPNPSCIVCSNTNPTILIRLNAELHTVGTFVQQILKTQLALAVPFVNVGSSVIWEDGDMESLRDAPLRRWLVKQSVELVVGCMNQSNEWNAVVEHDPSLLDVAHFSINGNDSASAEEMDLLRRTAQATQANSEYPPASSPATTGSVDDVQMFHPSKSHLHAAHEAPIEGPHMGSDDECCIQVD